MGDAIDDGLDNAEDVDAADKVYSQICDEIGVELGEEHEISKSKVQQPMAN